MDCPFHEMAPNRRVLVSVGGAPPLPGSAQAWCELWHDMVPLREHVQRLLAAGLERTDGSSSSEN